MEKATENATEQATNATDEHYVDGMYVAMWDSYAGKVIPDDAPSFQRRDMKQSYLAGGLAFSMCLSGALRAAEGDGEKLRESLDVLEGEIKAMVDEISSPEFIARALVEDIERLTGVRATLTPLDKCGECDCEHEDADEDGDTIRVATTCAGIDEDEAKDLAIVIAKWIDEQVDKRKAAKVAEAPTVQ